MISRYGVPIGILATFALSLLAMAAEPGVAIIKLAAGEQRTYHDDKTITRVAVGDPEIANLTVVSERQLLITGKRPGSTSFTVWYGTGGKGPGFTAEVLVTAPGDLADHGLDVLDADGLRVGEAGAKLKLEGESRSLESHAQAAQVIDDKAPQGVDAAALGFDAQVQIDIKIVEVSRSKLKDAGLFGGKNSRNSTLAISSPGNLNGVARSRDPGRFDAEGPFSLLSSSSFIPQLQAFNFVYGNSKGILGTLSLLEGNGFAYTLVEPTLVTMSGQSAKFLAGGEFPIPVPSAQGNGITIQYKEFGVRLTLTPTVLDANRIMLKVAPEVSDLDFSAAIQSGGVAVPALRVRRTDTSVALSNGETFIISGLISQDTVTNVDKVPGLGDIPYLGAFFRSTHLDRNEKELIMVVTPHLVRALAAGTKTPPLPGDRYREYDPSFFNLIFKEKGDFGAARGRMSGFSN